MIRTDSVPQNSDEWLQKRVGKVTGSIANLLLTRKKKEVLKENTEFNVHSFYTERGHILEEEAIEVYESIHKVKVERPGIVVNDKYPEAQCSPDGIDNECLLEVKAYAKNKHLSITKRNLPLKIMSQLQFNMLITGLKKSILILYNPDISDPKLAYREILIRRDLKTHNNLIRKLHSK